MGPVSANGSSSTSALINGASPTNGGAIEAGMRGKVRPRDARQARLGQSFAQVVAIFMRDPNYRALPVGDLEWLALPPLMAGQFRLGQTHLGGGKPAQEDAGMLLPVAVALWARVSDQIDATLSTTLDKQVRLKPDQWASGQNLWLMAVAGDPRALPTFLKQLRTTEFKGQTVKIRAHGKDGKVSIKTLEALTVPAPVLPAA